MSLYLSPPTGTVPFHKLEEYATKRLQFLVRLVACSCDQEMDEVLQDADVVDQSDCLITDTAKDTISHYILRLALGGGPESMSFFCDSELALFKLRVERMFADEWTVFFKSTNRFLCKLKGNVPVVHCSALSDLMLVFDLLKGKFESWHQLSSEVCSGKNTLGFINVPFQLVLRLVGGRLVDISKGMARVPVALLKEVFIEQFEKLLVTAAKRASLERELALGDKRIRRLTASLKSTLTAETKPLKHHPDHFPALRLSDLWVNSFLFPPCMANMVNVLQEQHRLKHHDRVQLTLFLKELGLPLNDALLLWKREYSVPANPSSSGHGWRGNERRYIYNIRHLYGLEGSRTDYRAHTCSSIQGRSLSCGQSGGCPFICQDNSTLESTCNDHGIDKCNIDHIVELCNQKKYGVACQKLMINKLEKFCKYQEIIFEKGNGNTTETKIGSSHSHKKAAQIWDNYIRTEGCHNEVSRRNESGIMESHSNYDKNNLPYRNIINSAVKLELKCDTNVSHLREMADNKWHIQRELINLGKSSAIDFKKSWNSGSSSNNPNLSEVLCRVCQKPIFETIINSSASDVKSDRHFTFASPLNTDSGKLNKSFDIINACQNNNVTSLTSDSNSGKCNVTMQKNKNIQQDDFLAISSHNFVANKFAYAPASSPHRFNSPWKCRNEVDTDNINIKTENTRLEGDNKISDGYQLKFVTEFQRQDGSILGTNLTRLRSDFSAKIPSSGTHPAITEPSSQNCNKDRKIYKQKRYLFKIKNNNTSKVGPLPKKMCCKLDYPCLGSQSMSGELEGICPNKQSSKRSLAIKPAEIVSRTRSSQQNVSSRRFKSSTTAVSSSFCCFKTGIDQVGASSNSVSKDGYAESPTISGAPSNSLEKLKYEISTFDAFTERSQEPCHETSLVELLDGSSRLLSCCANGGGHSSNLSNCAEISGHSKFSNCAEISEHSSNCDEISEHSSKLSNCAEISVHSSKLSNCAEISEHSSKLSNCAEISGHSSNLSNSAEFNEHSSELSHCAVISGHSSKLSPSAEISVHSSKLSNCTEISVHSSKLSNCAEISGHSSKLSNCAKIIGHSSKLSNCAEISVHSSALSHCAEISGHSSALSHSAEISVHSSKNSHQPEHEGEGSERLNIQHTQQAMEHSCEGSSPGPVKDIPRSGPCWKHSVCSLCKCLECCINKKTLQESSISSVSENPLVVRKPRDVYWLCRQHHK